MAQDAPSSIRPGLSEAVALILGALIAASVSLLTLIVQGEQERQARFHAERRALYEEYINIARELLSSRPKDPKEEEALLSRMREAYWKTQLLSSHRTMDAAYQLSEAVFGFVKWDRRENDRVAEEKARRKLEIFRAAARDELGID